MFISAQIKLKAHPTVKNGMFLLILVSLIFGTLCPTTSLAQELAADLGQEFPLMSQNYPSKTDVQSEAWYKSVGRDLQTNLLENGPGLLLLLFLSTFFSTINFYSSMARADSSLQTSFRYLLAWILVNYTLAMILLFLIIPKEVNLQEISQTMFLYCLIATAFPELAANIKLQMGEGKTALDLMKYKTKVAQYIDDQIARSIERDENYYLWFLESFYNNKPREFEARFTNFVNSRITDQNEIQIYTELLKANPISSRDILSEVRKNPGSKQKLLSFLGDIVENIKSFPEWELITGFNYRLTPADAKALVAANITTVGKLMKLRGKDPDFIDLGQKTNIKPSELNAAYYIAKKAWVTRFKRTLEFGLTGAAILALLIFLVFLQESHFSNSIDVTDDSLQTEEISNDDFIDEEDPLDSEGILSEEVPNTEVPDDEHQSANE